MRIGTARLGAQIASRRLARTTIRQNFIVDLLTFIEALETSLLDGADMDEHVLATIVGLDEAITLLRIKPFHGSRSQGKPFPK